MLSLMHSVLMQVSVSLGARSVVSWLPNLVWLAKNKAEVRGLQSRVGYLTVLSKAGVVLHNTYGLLYFYLMYQNYIYLLYRSG